MHQKRLLTLLLLPILSLPAHAQRVRCGTPERVGLPPATQFAPADCGYWTNSPEPEYEPGAGCILDVQVVFHVIQNNSGDGFLSASKIQDQIDILNEDFQAIAGTPGAPGTNGKIRFHLATTDPGGNPTTGITYTTNNSWFQDSGNFWDPLAWDTNRYMNVYTLEPPCCYGYVSGFASQGGLVGQADDYIVLWWEAVGRDATSGWPGNMGRTGTHEVGHYVGLYHTFDAGCGSASDCYRGNGDLICDTNPQSSPTYGCPSSESSCGSPDPFHNYMDYTDDVCLWEFTPEQMNRARCTLINWRPDVYTEDCGGPGGPTSYCDPANMNSLSSNGAVLAHVSGDPGELMTFSVSDLPNTPGVLFFGPGQGDTPFGCGRLCITGTLQRSGVYFPGGMSFQPVWDTTGIASTPFNIQYWYRDGSNNVFCGDVFNTSNALGF
jgi:hypothetical protein